MIKKWYIDLIKNKKQSWWQCAEALSIKCSVSILRLPAFAKAMARQTLRTIRAFRDVVIKPWS
jgi:hypothetical protein